MVFDPVKILSPKTMLYVARQGDTASKLALLENSYLSLAPDAERVLVFEAEPEVRLEAIEHCTRAEWVQEIISGSDVVGLEALTRNRLFFPFDDDALRPNLREPWRKPRKNDDWSSLSEAVLFGNRLVHIEHWWMQQHPDPTNFWTLDETLENPRDEGISIGEWALVNFYADLFSRLENNPVFVTLDAFTKKTYLNWWLRFPDNPVATARRLLAKRDPDITEYFYNSWLTPAEVAQELLEKAYAQDNVGHRKALTRHARIILSLASQERLWADPSVHVRAHILNTAAAPMDILIRLARDPVIQRDHLDVFPDNSKYYIGSMDSEEFWEILWERFKVTRNMSIVS